MSVTGSRSGSSGITPPLILALDIGSSSARAALVDGAGKRVPGSLIHSGYQQDTISSEHGSLDPHDLTRVVESLIDQVLALLGGNGAEIAAVGISTFWHSLMGIDADDKPVTRVLMWSDVRASSQCHAFEVALDPDAYRRRTGTPVHPSYPALKLFWLRNEEPERFARARRWLSFGEYLLRMWCGADNVSISMASATGMFDQTRLEWDQPTLQVLGIGAEQLSRVSDDPAKALRPTYTERWPALKRARWFPALGDGACANVGSGAIGRECIALSLGTSGAMRMLWEGDPVVPPDGLWLYRLDSRRVLLGGALSEGGNLWQWISERFVLPEERDLATAIAAIPPDSHGLTWLPFLAGERSVGWSPEAHGVISGLTLHTTSNEILRSGLEAIAYRFGLIAERLRGYVAEDHVVIGSGNALVNDRNWPQIVCDVIGNELIESLEPEASLRGAALVALERIGAIDRLDETAADILEGAKRFIPDAERHAIYLKGLARQQELYRKLLGG
ncbi:MAG: gluconokinase [Nitrolancea sp.]